VNYWLWSVWSFGFAWLALYLAITAPGFRRGDPYQWWFVGATAAIWAAAAPWMILKLTGRI